jgi:aerobic-type carbon monoxide dehydrogenase small subunit (CoxS/CutS family)
MLERRLLKKRKIVNESGSKGIVAQAVESIDNLKVSRRTFMKASIAGAAVAASVGAALETGTLRRPSTQAVTQVVDPFAEQNITLIINGQTYPVTVEPRDMLVNVIREDVGLIGTKRPCNRMECGGCTVLIDGKPYYSCTYLATRAQGKQIMTVEANNPGQLSTPDPVLAAIQQAWVANDASQCGYCQDGRIMAATALLKSNPNPSVDEIKAGLEGVLCRCGTYMNVIEAMQQAAQSLGSGA